MKFNKIASVFFSICAFLLFSCNNLTEKENLSDDEKRLATLKINLADSSRTVLPHLENLEDLTDFEFYGIISKNDYYKNLEYNSSSYYQYRNYYSSFSDLQNAEINLDVGEWTFTLTAKKDGSTYKGTKTQNIVQGENTISFELELFDSGTAKGSFSLTLDFSEAENADKVTSAKAVLQNINGTSVDGFETRNISVSNGKVCYSENTLPVGSYRALITLYSDDLELLTWREIVVIASDLVSEAERVIDSLNEVYHITYVLNDNEDNKASFLEVPVESFNHLTQSFELQKPNRDYYYGFDGWYEDKDFSGEPITKIETSRTENITLYAKWKELSHDVALAELSISDQFSYYIYDNAQSRNRITFSPEIHEYYIEYYCRTSIQYSRGKRIETVIGISLDGRLKDSNATVTASDNAEISFNNDEFCLKEYSLDSTIQDVVLTIAAQDRITENIYIFHTKRMFHFNENLFSNTIVTISDYVDFNYKEYGYKIYHCELAEKLKGLTGITLELRNAEASADNKYIVNKWAFKDCVALVEILLPDKVTTIYDSAFENCINLRSVVMSRDLTSIQPQAFKGASNLECIYLHDKLVTLCRDAFSDTPKLISIYYSGTKDKWEKIQNVSSLNWLGSSHNPVTVYCSDGEIIYQ